MRQVPGDPSTHRYKIRISRVFKEERQERSCRGCAGLNAGDVIWFDDTCALDMKVGGMYLVDLAGAVRGPLSINACGLTRGWGLVSRTDRRVLRRGAKCPRTR